MGRRAFQRLSLCVAALLALASSPSLAQSAAPPDDNGRLERSKEPLPATVRKDLDMVLSREAARKKIGLLSTNSFPMQFCDRGLCGAVNRDGTLAVPFRYNQVRQFFGGRAVVRMRHRDGHVYGYVDDTGRVIAQPQYAAAGRFQRGFAQIDVEGKSGLLDREGQVALWPQFGFVVPFTKDAFWATEQREIEQGNTGARVFFFDSLGFPINGMSDTTIKPKGKWGLVDRSGAWIKRPEFLDIILFDYSRTPMMWAKTESGWGRLKPDLTWQVEPKFEQVGHVQDGLAAIKLDGRWGFIDTAGRFAVEPRFDRVWFFTGPYAPAQIDKLVGLIDRTGKWVLEPQYDSIVSGGFGAPESWWSVEKDRKYGLLDDAFRVIIAPQLDQPVSMCLDGRILSRVGREWKVFTHDGTPEEGAKSCEN